MLLRALVMALFLAAPTAVKAADITVFAAASLSDVMTRLAADYHAATGKDVAFSLAASSALARQIEAAGGADLFISADQEWMDYLAQRGLIQTPTRKALLSNRLVLIAPQDSRTRVMLTPSGLAAALGDGRLAIADPASVPAGRYGKAALEKLGAWGALEHRLAPAENVRVALSYVARGEAPLGIVYATDARAEPGVKVMAVFPENTHPPIVYPAALTRDARPQARAFLAWLSGPKAARVFRATGFGIGK